MNVIIFEVKHIFFSGRILKTDHIKTDHIVSTALFVSLIA